MNLKLSQKMYFKLEEQIKQAQKQGLPIEKYVQQQIKLLEEVHDDFVAQGVKKIKALSDEVDFDETKIKQLQAIASLCKKIGLPTEKYEKQIFDIRANRFGAEFVRKNF